MADKNESVAELMSAYLIRTEDRTPQASIENLYKLINTHGVPIGAIHRISPQDPKGTRNHVTAIFFWNGYVHEFMGFKCGEPTKETQQHIIGLIDALSKIPFIVPYLYKDDYIFSIGTPKVLAEFDKKYQNDYVSLNYIFRPPAAECPQAFTECEGTIVMEKFIQYISTDPSSELIEGDW